MKRLPISLTATLLSLVLLLVLSGCRPGEPAGEDAGPAAPADPFGSSVVAEVVGSPRDGDARIRVEAEHLGVAADDAAVVVTADMFHAGMAPVVVEAAPLGDGQYLTPPLEFEMSGDWIVTVDVTFTDGWTAREALLLTVRQR